MMFKNFITVAISAILIASSAQAQNFEDLAPKEPHKEQMEKKASSIGNAAGTCMDDPRLETDLVAIMESDSAPTPSLTVTPETFLNMNEEVVAKLGGKMKVCPNNPLLKNGKTMKKIQIDFTPLWANIKRAAVDGNRSAVRNLLDNFRVLPLPSEEIVKLMVPLNMNEKAAQELSEAAGMPFDARTLNDKRVVEFYTLLGGTATDNVPVCTNNYIDGKAMEQIKENFKDNVIFMLGQVGDSADDKERAIKLLKAANVNATPCSAGK